MQGAAVAVDEVRTRLRERLEREYGVEEAGILMDRPPGGWSDLVTHESLRRELERFEARFEAKMDLKFAAMRSDFTAQLERGFREQTWRLMTATLAAMGSLVAAMAVFVALAR